MAMVKTFSLSIQQSGDLLGAVCIVVVKNDIKLK